MADTFDTVSLVLAADVLNAGTFAVGYPTGRDSGAYTGGFDHQVVTNDYGVLYALEGDVGFSFGASSITVTNSSGLTLKAGTRATVQLDRPGANVDENRVANPDKMAMVTPVRVNLGAPDVADPDGVCASQSLNTGTDGLINGALAANSIATFDVPRNVVAAWTGAAVITVTGKDEYGATVVESSASGTSLAGKKAFKTVTKVRVSANVTGLTVGTGDVLGLPLFLGNVASVIREAQDGAVAAAGTVVAGVGGLATATTGDVRGTYDPNAAADGAKSFQLDILSGDPKYKGSPQFAG